LAAVGRALKVLISPMIRRLIAGLAGLVLLVMAPTAYAFDPEQTFMPRTLVVSPEVGYGDPFAFAGVRVGLLPFGPTGSGPLYGALEVGLEGLYLDTTGNNGNNDDDQGNKNEPNRDNNNRNDNDNRHPFASLGLTVRYHFLSLGRFVPYAEVAGFAGVTENNSDLAFLVWGGFGASYFVTDRVAIYAGYRWQHIANGDRARVSDSHAGVLGVSFFFE
jgi:opacity protein-like surface antigen